MKQIGRARCRGTFRLCRSNTSLDFLSSPVSPLVRQGEEREKQGQKKEGLSNWEGEKRGRNSQDGRFSRNKQTVRERAKR